MLTLSLSHLAASAIIEDITRTEIHYWRRNEDEDLIFVMLIWENRKEKKTLIEDKSYSLCYCNIRDSRGNPLLVFLFIKF